MIRSPRSAAALVLILTLAGASASAQANALKPGSLRTDVDGVVSPGEYSWTRTFGPIRLDLNLTPDALYVAVVGNTRGWVAVGLGSLVMNRATIFIGYVGRDGKTHFKPQTGSGHRHFDAAASVSETILSSAMKQAGGRTTLEIALKPGSYVKAGQASLDIIYAMGSDADFTTYHSYRGAVSVPLAP